MVLQLKILQQSRNQGIQRTPVVHGGLRKSPVEHGTTRKNPVHPSATWFSSSKGKTVCSNRDGQRGALAPFPRGAGPHIVTILVTFGSAYLSRSLKTNSCNHTDAQSTVMDSAHIYENVISFVLQREPNTYPPSTNRILLSLSTLTPPALLSAVSFTNTIWEPFSTFKWDQHHPYTHRRAHTPHAVTHTHTVTHTQVSALRLTYISVLERLYCQAYITTL